MRNNIKYVARLGLLSALAILLSALEGLLLPLLPPGVHPGISNTVTMLAAAELGLPAALIIALIKAVFALVTRGTVAFGMSLCGGVLSVLAMWALFRFGRERLGLLGISMLGAFCHNAGQLALSLLLFGRAIWAYAPVLLFTAVPAGLLTGVLLKACLHLIRKPLHTKKENSDEA